VVRGGGRDECEFVRADSDPGLSIARRARHLNTREVDKRASFFLSAQVAASSLCGRFLGTDSDKRQRLRDHQRDDPLCPVHVTHRPQTRRLRQTIHDERLEDGFERLGSRGSRVAAVRCFGGTLNFHPRDGREGGPPPRGEPSVALSWRPRPMEGQMRAGVDMAAEKRPGSPGRLEARGAQDRPGRDHCPSSDVDRAKRFYEEPRADGGMDADPRPRPLFHGRSGPVKSRRLTVAHARSQIRERPHHRQRLSAQRLEVAVHKTSDAAVVRTSFSHGRGGQRGGFHLRPRGARSGARTTSVAHTRALLSSAIRNGNGWLLQEDHGGLPGAEVGRVTDDGRSLPGRNHPLHGNGRSHSRDPFGRKTHCRAQTGGMVWPPNMGSGARAR